MPVTPIDLNDEEKQRTTLLRLLEICDLFDFPKLIQSQEEEHALKKEYVQILLSFALVDKFDVLVSQFHEEARRILKIYKEKIENASNN